jgi:Cft2 family RNA processing exonuclease
MTNLDIVLEYLILQAHNQNKSGHAEINNLVRFVESIDTESRAVKKHKAKIETRAFQVLQNLTNGNESINSTELSNSFIESFLYKGL